LKSAVIASELKKRFGGPVPILSVTGIRADESKARAKQPVHKPNPRLTRVSDGTHGHDWNAILDWTLDEVIQYLADNKFPLHEAYEVYGSSRVSCCFCIMSSGGDLIASASCPDNHDIYRLMVDLELRSTFAFQDSKWLCDVNPELLTEEQRQQVLLAKLAATARQTAEKLIPKHLEYEKGWPNVLPTLAEAALLANVRLTVGKLIGIPMQYTDATAIIDRYDQLMKEKPTTTA
jgi:hypothetical protein